jgi:hypothetical protein
LGFEAAMSARTDWFKVEALDTWIAEKHKEVAFLETRSKATESITKLERVVDERRAQLKGRYDYLQQQPRYHELVREVDFAATISFALASVVIAKVNALVHAEEDRKLATVMKKMDLDKPAVVAAQQAPSNELSELKKLVVDLSKKVDINSKKVRENLYSFLCLCAGHLSLTTQFLNNLVLDTVEAGWEEIRERQGQGEEGKVRTNRNQKGQKGKGRSNRRASPSPKRPEDLAEVKGEGQQEQGWQEVSATFGLSFGTDSAVRIQCTAVASFPTCTVWTLICFVRTVASSVLSFPPSVLLDRRLRYPRSTLLCSHFMYYYRPQI